MSSSTSVHLRRIVAACALALPLSFLGGCAVIGVAATVGGLAVDAAVGTVKLTGKAIGAAADAVTPDTTK